MLTIRINKEENELIVSFKSSTTKNENKNSITFSLDKNSELTNDNIANFLTTLSSELLSDDDNFAFDFQTNIEHSNNQIDFVKQLIQTFINTFKKNYELMNKKMKQKITEIKNNIEKNNFS
ncbi:MAG: hypothetical protein LBF97_05725 [Elusimicrobiota bacterium]|jgi:hypothetical protein|nr:hypothetical protein [Elusimicrobiota bacterium]